MKTKVYQIYHNETEELLGEIKWSCNFRQYCFYPEQDTFWSNGCLQEIQNFINKLSSESKLTTLNHGNQHIKSGGKK